MTTQAPECPAGSYGPQCEKPCPERCQDNICNKVAGFCTGCQPGWKGLNCDKACDFGRFGKGCTQLCSYQCSNVACNVVDGSCDGGCARGYKPPDCNAGCDIGFHGYNCTEPCPQNCEGACDSKFGTCLQGCVAGYRGDLCDTECDPTFYGVGCKENCNKACTNSLCHHVTGACKDCPPGRTGEACERNCTLGTYGNNCSQRCSEHCKGNQGCNNLNGECNEGCNSGYRGSFCNTTCETLKYGENCKSNCSQFCVVDASTNPSVCHHETGECRLGCVSGYEGLQCIQLKSTSAETGVNSGAVAGPIIVVLLLIIAVVIGLFVWRRRKRTKRSNVLDNGSLGNLTDFSLSGSHSINAGNNGSVKPAKFSVDKPPLYPSISDNATTGEKRDEVYNNIIPGPSKTVIAVGDLNTFMLSHSKEYFAEEFKKIPSPSNISMSIGQSAENKNKNRYKNICAYDHSRVKLISNGEKGQGDYINASYIQGYDNKETFIASQGPSKVIIEDFIRMLWEQKCDAVVMLTNLVEDAKQKCEKYWPDENELMFGEIKIRLIDSQMLSDCVIRKLQLSKANLSTHTLTQFHFTAWPDKGVPTNPKQDSSTKLTLSMSSFVPSQDARAEVLNI